MKCSRITLLLALMILGGVAAARATDDLTAYPLSKADVLRLLYLDIVRPAEWFESAADWRGDYKATDAGDDSLLYSDDNLNNPAVNDGARQDLSSDGDNSSGSEYSGYYGNDASATEMNDSRGEKLTAKSDRLDAAEATEDPTAGGQDDVADPSTPPSIDDDATKANTTQQSDDEEGMIVIESESQTMPAADEPKADAQQSAPVDPSSREIHADGNAEFFDDYGVEYVYSVPQAKFANRAEVAAVCCSMLSRLGSLAVLSGDGLYAAARNVSRQIVQIDWDSLLDRMSASGVREQSPSDMEEAYR
jgi:hypothetical protein